VLDVLRTSMMSGEHATIAGSEHMHLPPPVKQG